MSLRRHERYNLEEGWAFLEISYGLLLEGAAFCRRPDVGVEIAALQQRLEGAMAYHRSSKTFDDWLEKAIVPDCDISHVEYVAQFTEMRKTLDDQALPRGDSADPPPRLSATHRRL